MTRLEQNFFEAAIKYYCRANTSTIPIVDNPEVSQPPIDWEQRRYEIAKDAMSSLIGRQSALAIAKESGQPLIVYASKISVEYADALIGELKKNEK